jgi:hypothetical protein
MEITTEKHNEGLVKLLIKMLRSCDGETVNHVLEESGQAEYAFQSILRGKEELREHVGCLNDVVEMYHRVNFIQDEIKGIETWADKNCIDISKCGANEYPLSTHLGNLEEIADLDNQIDWCKKYPDSEVLPDEDGKCSLCGCDCGE